MEGREAGEEGRRGVGGTLLITRTQSLRILGTRNTNKPVKKSKRNQWRKYVRSEGGSGEGST